VTAFRKEFHFTWTTGVNIRTNAPSQQEGKPMHDDFASLFAFNRWANAKMFDACRKLTPEQYVAEPVPGWSSVAATVYHITLVTELWLRGLEGDPDDTIPTEHEIATVEDAERLLDRAYQRFNRLLPTLTPERLATPLTMQRRGRTITMPPWAILRHVVNHTTYHRGQVASKLKRFGIQQEETDLVFWCKEQMPQSK
jgi:uncharacterized damage-inducible protein DinB